MPHYLWQGEDLVLRCHIQPNASSDTIVGIHGDRLKLRIQAPPIDGKANLYLIHWMSNLFGVPKSQITVEQGDFGRMKTLRIISPQRLPAAAQIPT